MTEVKSSISSSLNGSLHLNTEVYEALRAIGCCKMCVLRFCGRTEIQTFRNFHNAIEDKKHECTGTDNGLKKLASNPCIACLGMLQPPMCDKIIDKIVEAVNRESYDNPVFNVAFTLPVSFYLRAHAVLLFLVNKFPDYFKDNFPLGVVTVGVKDAWKYVYSEKLAKQLNKTFNTESEFKIQIDVQYEDDHAEISCLHDMYPNKFKEQKIKGKKLRRLKGPTFLFSRKSVESVLNLEERDHFAQFYTVPPPVPSHAATCNNVFFEHTCIYIAGRYNKYVRGLPQTAWFVNNQRKLETSVHELIGESVQAITKSQGSKFISSGREDVDVRMLGSGRPFALELLSPRHVVLSALEMKELELKINAVGAGRVSVSQLKVVPKSSLEILKKGEQLKTKTYVAYCMALGVDQTRLMTVCQQAPLTLQQRTPVRVLHRRPIATRPKIIHWMIISDVKSSQVDNTTYFKITLNAQAGTYIKEFIHGDFGRTNPSLGDLLGGLTADCLALDVQSIELEWPPQ